MLRARVVKKLTPEEQMALFEKDLKENDWGHQRVIAGRVAQGVTAPSISTQSTGARTAGAEAGGK